MDLTQINQAIDDTIKDQPPRNITPGVLRATLKAVTTYLNDLTSGKLSAWFKVGAGTPSLNATDDIYHTGKVLIGKSADDGSGAALQANTFSLSGVSFLGGTGMMPTETTDFDTLNQVGTYCIGGSVWGTGMHAPGNAFTGVFPFGTLIVSRSSAGNCSQMYIDNSQNYIYLRHKWATNAWGAWVCVNRPVDMIINNSLSFDVALNNKKIALYPGPNDHQFFGFGIASGTLRYQIADNSASHVFYVGLTPATSQELLRFQGNGLADFAYNGRFKGNVTPGLGVGVEISYNAVPNAGSIICYDRTGAVYKDLYLDAATLVINSSNGGKVAIGTSAPTSSLHVKGSTGHQQFRLETDYTPTGSADPNGAIGQVCFDANYCYKKSAAGWKRSPIFTTF